MLRRLRSATLDDLLVALLVVVIGGLAALTLLYWVTGQIAGRVFGGAWPHMGFVEMGGVMVDALRNPADPTSAWPRAEQELLPGPVGFYAVMFLLFLLPAAAFAGFMLMRLRGRARLRGAPPGPGRPPAAARPLGRRRGPGWARGRDLRRLQVRPGGEPGRLTLGKVDGKLIAAEPGQAVIVLGPPGSGKTTGLVIPAVLEWEGPVVVATASVELVTDTARRRGELGGVWAFDPGGVSSSLPRAGWSPLDAAATWEESVRTAGSLVTAATPAAPDGGGHGPDTAGLLAPLLYAANRSFLGLGELARWAQRQDRDEVVEVLATTRERAAGDAFEAVWGLPDAVRAELYADVQRVLAPWTDPRVRRALAPSADRSDELSGRSNGDGHRDGAEAAADASPPGAAAQALGANGSPLDGGEPRWEPFTPSSLLDGGINTLYLVAPPHELQRHRPLLTALLQEVLSAVYERAASGDGRRLDPPLLVVLDDAAEVAALRSLDVHASTAGGQGVQLLSVFRNAAQVRARYGERADNVITSHRARVILSGTTDPATLDYLSNLLGDERFRPAAPASDAPASGGRAARRRRSAPPPPPRGGGRASPVDVLRQPRSAAGLLVYGYLPAAEVELRPWFQDRRLRALAGTTRTVVGRPRGRSLGPMSGRRPPRARDVFPDLPAPTTRRDRPRS